MSASRASAGVAYAVLGLLWGAAFLFMTWSTEVISPAQTALLRVVFGIAPVAVFALSRRAFAGWHLRHLHHLVVMSLLAMTFYYYATASGTALLDSGVAGGLTGSIPLFALVAGVLVFRVDTLDRRRLLGLAVGTVGVVLLARPWDAGGVDPAGVAFMLGASASLGVSFAYARRFVSPLGIPASALASYQLLLALIGLLLVTDLDGISRIGSEPVALLGVAVGLGALGTGLAYVLYYVAVSGLGALTASTVTYLPPAVAMAIGVLALGEPVTLTGLLGLGLILAAAWTARPVRPSA